MDARQVADVCRESNALRALARCLLDEVLPQRRAGTVPLGRRVRADALEPHLAGSQVDGAREYDDGSVRVGDCYLRISYSEPFVDIQWNVVVAFPYLGAVRNDPLAVGKPRCASSDSHTFLLWLQSDGRLSCPVRSIHDRMPSSLLLNWILLPAKPYSNFTLWYVRLC